MKLFKTHNHARCGASSLALQFFVITASTTRTHGEVGAVPDFNQSSRIERGNYSVEVLRGSDSADQFWYYIIQRKGSNEIIDLVKFDTYEEAMESARQVLATMNRAAPGTLNAHESSKE